MARRKQPPQTDHIILAIDHAKPSYSLTAGHRAEYRVSPEYFTLELQCTCLYPLRFAEWKIPTTFYGERDFWDNWSARQDNPDHQPSVAVATLRRNNTFVTGWLPFDVLTSISSLTCAGMLTHVVLYGPPISRGSTLPHHISFERDLDPSDYF